MAVRTSACRNDPHIQCFQETNIWKESKMEFYKTIKYKVYISEAILYPTNNWIMTNSLQSQAMNMYTTPHNIQSNYMLLNKPCDALANLICIIVCNRAFCMCPKLNTTWRAKATNIMQNYLNKYFRHNNTLRWMCRERNMSIAKYFACIHDSLLQSPFVY